jgi:signal transduction histidine kinase
VSVRRPLDDSYHTFFDMLGQAVANALAKAHAYEQERKRAEALAELDRAKTVFFSNISHEFRTPLTLMLGPLDELFASSLTEISQVSKDRLAVVKRNGLRLLRLVNTLLEFSRIEAGRTQASYVPTDLAAFTADLASSFRSATDRAGIRLIVSCPALPKPVYVDRDMWEKIVLNLMSNAFKFTFEGEIAVTMASVDDVIELRVCDTGVGIPAQEVPRLFERFYRVQNTRSRTHEGSGIGLALVQELVGSAHLSPDRIEAESTDLSTPRGAEPFVEEVLRWLPDESNGIEEGLAPSDVMPMPFRPSSHERVHKHPRILVADDNADMRQYIARLLSERYDVTVVADGEAAFRAACADVPDLILSDVMMPRLHGFGLLRAIRNHPGIKTIPVILLSARAGEEASIEGLEEGADDYLIKPFSARELLARVAAHLEMARVREEFRLRTLATESNVAEQRERKQIAMELHDHLQQLLVLGKLKLSQCRRVGELNPATADIISQTDDLLSEALRYTRTLVVELSPPVLREHGLAAGLTWLAESMKRYDMVVTVRIPEPDTITLTEDQAALLFQSVRELLFNASKHAQSHEATVTLEWTETQLRIEVKDHGAGFSLAADPTAPDPSSLSSRFGLFNIRKRMEALGGRLVIGSAPGIGTTATLMFPMPSGKR